MEPIAITRSPRGLGWSEAAVVCLAAGALLALGASAPERAPRVTAVTLATFGAEPPPLFRVAAHHRLFETFGVSVRVEPRWTSRELREGLAAGTFTFVQSLVDNAVAVQEDLGVPVVIVMGRGGGGAGVDLVVQRDVGGFDDLRGRTILVDSPDTGHALALRKMLKTHGLLAGRDYTMLPLGQTQKRFEAMQANREYAGTMAPFSPEAKRLGFRTLGHAATLVGEYDASGVYGRREWIEAHRDVTVGFLAGYLYARRWVADPGNRRGVIQALSGSAGSAAEEQYARVLAANRDGDPDFDLEAFRNGLALRAEIEGTWAGTPPPAERYYDFSYLARARALLDRMR